MDGNGIDATGFVIDELDYLDSIDFEVLHPVTGVPTGWKITFAGPAHLRTIAVRNELMRRVQREERARELAKATGRPWSGDDKTPEEMRLENVSLIADRILGWSPLNLNGQEIPYSPQAARGLLLDPRKEWLRNQCLDFVLADQNFMKRSARNLSPLPSTNSDSPNETARALATESI